MQANPQQPAVTRTLDLLGVQNGPANCSALPAVYSVAGCTVLNSQQQERQKYASPSHGWLLLLPDQVLMHRKIGDQPECLSAPFPFDSLTLQLIIRITSICQAKKVTLWRDCWQGHCRRHIHTPHSVHSSAMGPRTSCR